MAIQLYGVRVRYMVETKYWLMDHTPEDAVKRMLDHEWANLPLDCVPGTFQVMEDTVIVDNNGDQFEVPLNLEANPR